MSSEDASVTAVLVVEDDPDLLGAITEVLADAGYTVVHAVDGLAALEVLTRIAVSAIITDLSMPGMDGLELLAAHAATPEAARIPVVLMTGSETVATPPPGCVAVLSKPFSLESLLAIVREHAGAPAR